MTVPHFASAGHGPAVLMIQGVGVAGSGWNPQIDALAPDYTVITFDNRGIGRTPRGDAPLSIGGMVDDAVAVMDANGADRCHVVGHSMGGAIAQELAFRYRYRVSSLCLMCTVARGAEATALTRRMLWLGLRSRIGTRAMRRAAFLDIVMPPGALRGVDRAAMARDLAALFGHDLADSPPIIMEQLRALSAWDGRAQLAALGGLPTLVLSGAHDPIARPASMKTLADGIPGATHVAFPDASHGLPIHHASAVNRLLRSHLAPEARIELGVCPDLEGSAF